MEYRGKEPDLKLFAENIVHKKPIRYSSETLWAEEQV